MPIPRDETLVKAVARAREITGAHWSGPRFFGLRKRVGSTAENAEGEHAQA